jgi:hypothetical protein
LGGALSDLGEEAARRLAQRLPKPQGELLLAGYHAPPKDARPKLHAAVVALGLTLEEPTP